VESTLSAYHGGVGEREAINGPLLSSASSWLDRRSRRSGVYHRSSLLLDFGGIGLRRNSQSRQASRGCVHERHFSLRDSQDRYWCSSTSESIAGVGVFADRVQEMDAVQAPCLYTLWHNGSNALTIMRCYCGAALVLRGN
jgi:hypothetical protein